MVNCFAGSTCYFFRDSDNKSDYRKMWEKMQFSSEESGIDRITKDAGGFAFFLESKAIEYIQERKCTVTQVGNLLDTKGNDDNDCCSTTTKRLLA